MKTIKSLLAEFVADNQCNIKTQHGIIDCDPEEMDATPYVEFINNATGIEKLDRNQASETGIDKYDVNVFRVTNGEETIYVAAETYLVQWHKYWIRGHRAGNKPWEDKVCFESDFLGVATEEIKSYAVNYHEEVCDGYEVINSVEELEGLVIGYRTDSKADYTSEEEKETLSRRADYLENKIKPVFRPGIWRVKCDYDDEPYCDYYFGNTYWGYDVFMWSIEESK